MQIFLASFVGALEQSLVFCCPSTGLGRPSAKTSNSMAVHLLDKRLRESNITMAGLCYVLFDDNRRAWLWE